MLRVENLQAGYGSIVALKDVSMEVFEGEIITIIGANGAGKSTLLSCISGLMPYKGSITFAGEVLGPKADSSTRVKKGLIQVPEGRQIFGDLSVLENLRMGAYARERGMSFQQEVSHVFDLFPRLGERKHQKGGSLSGGEQQMLAMGRAMMAKPKLLLLDEPSMGLAPVIVMDIFKIIHRLNQEGVTIVLIEQNANLALKTAHRAYVLETGNVMLSGEAKELANDSKIRELYLGG